MQNSGIILESGGNIKKNCNILLKLFYILAFLIAYYQENAPKISNAEYVQQFFTLKDLEEEKKIG